MTYLSQDTLLTHILNTHSQYTFSPPLSTPLNPSVTLSLSPNSNPPQSLSQDTLSAHCTHTVNTHSQYTFSHPSHPLSPLCHPPYHPLSPPPTPLSPPITPLSPPLTPSHPSVTLCQPTGVYDQRFLTNKTLPIHLSIFLTPFNPPLTPSTHLTLPLTPSNPLPPLCHPLSTNRRLRSTIPHQ